MMLDLDQTVQAALNSQTMPGYGPFFSLVTLLGSAYLWLALLLGCMLLNRWRAVAAVLLITMTFGMVINEDIKDIAQRLRPEGIIVSGYFSEYNYSFPSGHSQTAFTIATVLSAFIAWRYNFITYLLATAVGMSRIYLGVHYFSDVVTGALLGILIGELAVYGAYRFGLAPGYGIILEAVRRLLPNKEKVPSHGEAIRKGVVTLIFGFGTVMLLLHLGQYVMSLATVSFVYLLLLSETGTLKKAETPLA